MPGQQSHAHHYVPQWYQRRFLLPGQSRYHYLDMNPDTVVREGISYRRNDRLHWSPARCFYKDDLYTLRFGPATTDVMERLFFGMVDRLGMSAVTEMAEFAGIGSLRGPDAFRNLPSTFIAESSIQNCHPDSYPGGSVTKTGQNHKCLI